MTKPLREDTQRLWDLVRYQRGPLHDADCITDEEYAVLAGDWDAKKRLETYDEMGAEIARLREQVQSQQRVIDERPKTPLQQAHESNQRDLRAFYDATEKRDEGAEE